MKLIKLNVDSQFLINVKKFLDIQGCSICHEDILRLGYIDTSACYQCQPLFICPSIHNIKNRICNRCKMVYCDNCVYFCVCNKVTCYGCTCRCMLCNDVNCWYCCDYCDLCGKTFCEKCMWFGWNYKHIHDICIICIYREKIQRYTTSNTNYKMSGFKYKYSKFLYFDFELEINKITFFL